MRINPVVAEAVSDVEDMTVDVVSQEEVAVISGLLDEELLTPKQVAVLFRVDPKTVSRWARAGKIGCVITPGGHRRYRSAEVHALLRTRTTFPNDAGRM